MNYLLLYTKIYGALNVKYLPYWFFTPARRFIRKVANIQIPKWFESQREKQNAPQYVEEGLIVSFTSFPARINNVWKVVESLKCQSVLPEKVILWLSKEQFPTQDLIPEKLRNMQNEFFDIRLVNEDIRSHKKYYYTLIEYPSKSFITCDDDVYYDPYMIQRLVETSRLFPHCIIANHTSKIVFKSDGNVSSYSDFVGGIKPYSSKDLIQIGIGGVFYPANCLYELVLNKELFMLLAPLADDIWLNTMARLNGTAVVQSSKDMLALPIEDGAPSLSDINNGENKNDVQIAKIREYLKSHGMKDVYYKSQTL